MGDVPANSPPNGENLSLLAGQTKGSILCSLYNTSGELMATGLIVRSTSTDGFQRGPTLGEAALLVASVVAPNGLLIFAHSFCHS